MPGALREVQFVLVRPDGQEVLLAEFVEDAHAPVSWTPGQRVVGAYGKRVKGPAGDADWAGQKGRLLETAKAKAGALPVAPPESYWRRLRQEFSAGKGREGYDPDEDDGYFLGWLVGRLYLAEGEVRSLSLKITAARNELE